MLNKENVMMTSKQMTLFESFMGLYSKEELVELLDEGQALLVVHCEDVYSMIPKIHTALQDLKVLFREMEKLERQRQAK
jgi:hypothetical protein